jgi:hypothetical protein
VINDIYKCILNEHQFYKEVDVKVTRSRRVESTG